MKIETVKTNELTLDPNNARVHSEKSVEAIANSLAMYGLRKPVVIDSDNRVVAGNGTLEAARKLNWETIAAVRLPKDWSEEMIKAFAIADNRTAELSEWNKEILAEQLIDLEEEDFDIYWLGFEMEVEREEKILEEFPSFDNDTETSYCCPKCSYEWNGSPR
jgi:site-specific DNA-methyltransferase (adenine-specific)